MRKHLLFKNKRYVEIIVDFPSDTAFIAQVKDSTIKHHKIIHDGIFNLPQETIELFPIIAMISEDNNDKPMLLNFYDHSDLLRAISSTLLKEKVSYKDNQLFVCITDLAPCNNQNHKDMLKKRMDEIKRRS